MGHSSKETLPHARGVRDHPENDPVEVRREWSSGGFQSPRLWTDQMVRVSADSQRGGELCRVKAVTALGFRQCVWNSVVLACG